MADSVIGLSPDEIRARVTEMNESTLDEANARALDAATDLADAPAYKRKLVAEMLLQWPASYTVGTTRESFVDAVVELVDLATASYVPLRGVKTWWLRWTLQTVRGDRTRAADLGGIDRKTLYRMMRTFGVDVASPVASRRTSE